MSEEDQSPEAIAKAINNLHEKAGSMFDYPAKNINWMDGEEVFKTDNPDHPNTSPERFVRIGAADFFLRLARDKPESIKVDILQELHVSLFDRCASVRHSIADALGRLKNKDSVVHLKRLLEVEDESEMVRTEARKALENCEQAQN